MLHMNIAGQWTMMLFLTGVAVFLSTLSAVSHPNHGSQIEPRYQACERVFRSAPAATLFEFVARGNRATFSPGDLDALLKGLQCSDDQIIAYMTHHGLPYHSKIERGDVFKGQQGNYNRILDFCTPHRTALRRMISGECRGVTRFMMVDDKVSYIISHGFR
ncbi:MAG: hypothetical protein ABJM43_11795 [Paracoccaceae bacterium]